MIAMTDDPPYEGGFALRLEPPPALERLPFPGRWSCPRSPSIQRRRPSDDPRPLAPPGDQAR